MIQVFKKFNALPLRLRIEYMRIRESKNDSMISTDLVLNSKECALSRCGEEAKRLTNEL